MRIVVLIALLGLGGALWGQLSQSGVTSNEPGLIRCGTSAIVSVGKYGTAPVIAGQPGKSIFVCGLVMNSGGKTRGALVQGSGASCSVQRAGVTPAFEFASGTVISLGGSAGSLLKTAPGNGICAVNHGRAALNVQLIYAQY